MINLINLSKHYGSRVLFEQVNMQMGQGERLGLVGRNGHGKSTLFKLILKQELPDEGQIVAPKNYRIGHLEQHLHFIMPTILEEACLGLQDDEKDHIYKAEAILFGLGFTKSDMDRSPSDFSGGYQIRINLAKILVNHPNLLLLDEPTNYLDILSIRWLVKFLRQWKNELILITHDRHFMDQVTTHTAMIHRLKVKKISGGTQKIFDQIALEEEVYEKTRINDQKKKKEIEEFVNRFRAKASKATMVQSRIKMLESMPTHEKLANINRLGFEFNYSPTQAKNLLHAENISFSYDPQNPLIKNFSLDIKHGEKIAIIGKNGKGKSTLLNLLANNITPQSGLVEYHGSVKAGVFGQTNISRLNPKLSIEEEIAAENQDLPKTAIRSICATMMFTQDDATKKVSVLSGGEKSRVLIGKILAKESNLLFLDEPTNHLDMDSIEALTSSLIDFPGAAVIVTHSEDILRTLPTRFIVFQNQGHEIFNGTYDEFLAKVGWEEEKESSSAPAEGDRNKHHKKNELTKEKNKALNPLKKLITQIEDKITSLEQKITQHNASLVTAIDSNDFAQITAISKKISDDQKLMDELFVQLEEKSLHYQNEENRFNGLINDLF